MSAVEFRPLPLPSTPDGAEAADFREMVAVTNRVWREIAGHDDHSRTPQEVLAAARSDAHERRLFWLVLEDGRVVGRLGMDIPLEAGSRSAYPTIELVREAWGHGIGAAANTLLEDVARTEGRTILQTWIEHSGSESERLPSPTGFGAVPRDHSARFLLRHGYTLEQVVRMSAYDLQTPIDDLRVHAERARAAATGYRTVQWELPTPDEFIDGYAWMKSRMSTDAPNAGLVIDEEVWDADRLRHHDAEYLDGGRRMLVTAAQHIATGELCAFNELVIGQDPSAASHQEDTLVLATHRGHRLGMLVKAEGLLAWRERWPDSPRVITYNAEENRPMLDINEAIGFTPQNYEGAWKKVLG